MDISSITPTEREIELRHPGTGNPLGIKLRLRSIQSKEVKAVQRRIQDAALKLRAKGKTFTSQQVEENTLRLIKSAVVGWTWENNDIELNGEKHPKFNSKNIDALISIEWVQDQIDEELGDLSTFFSN